MIVQPAAGDCELIREGLWGQPANSVSSLVFVVVGIALLQRRPVLGWLACAVGVGSFLFHGPMPTGAKWVHDVSLAVFLVGIAFEDRPRIVMMATVVLGAVLAVAPGTAAWVTAVVGVAALLVVMRTTIGRQPGVVLASIGILTVGAVIAATSRTDGPLCAPESLLQGHASWHLLGAMALWVWGRYGGLGSSP